MGKAQDVIERYYSAFNAKASEWRDLVTDDVTLRGPLQQANGKAEFVALTEQFMQALREIKLLGRAESGDKVFSVYEFQLDTPDGGTMSCEVAEVARVSGNRVAEWTLLYDPREFARRFGM